MAPVILRGGVPAVVSPVVDVLVLSRLETPECHAHCLCPHVELAADGFVGVPVLVTHDQDPLHVVLVDLLVVPPGLLLADGAAPDLGGLLEVGP